MALQRHNGSHGMKPKTMSRSDTQTVLPTGATRPKPRSRVVVGWLLCSGACLTAALMLGLRVTPALSQVRPAQPVQSGEQKSVSERLSGLRGLPDDERARVTNQLALDIRRLPRTAEKLGLATGLANLATEGDCGRESLQNVAITLAEALSAQPASGTRDQSAEAYNTLAQLVRYENVRVSSSAPQFTAAMAKLEADDRRRQDADFTLSDLQGKPWTLKSLHGKVVLVNFWATWCPPCRKEIPDLETLSNRFREQGLVVLGISDEDAAKVRPFVAQHAMTYPVLLDPGRKVNKLFVIQSIPRTLIYDRSGKLAVQAIDMRTQKQLLALLARAGLR